MIAPRWRSRFASIFLSLLLLLTACTANPPSRYEQVQKETTQRGAPSAVAKEAVSGGSFNKFFPNSVRGYQIIPTQEKKGFAEYKVKKDGQTVAMLSINDTISNPTAAAKFKDTPLTIAGYPAVEQGTTATGILVSDRYQVKVLSRDPSFTKEDRAAWLQKFDLKGLAQIQSALSPQTPKLRTKTPTLLPQPAT
jgi:hypothetical protein